MQEAPAGSMDSAPFRGGGQGTLDEPVMETFMRDVRSIGEKLKFVLVPKKSEDQSKALREWDLWGPLLLCLAMSIILSLQSKGSDQAGQVFALVFVLVWIGSAVVTANAVLLKVTFLVLLFNVCFSFVPTFFNRGFCHRRWDKWVCMETSRFP